MEDLIIPFEQLDSDTLRKLVEDFITREGTEYGEEEMPLKDKIDLVIDQLKTGETVITWSTETESSNIVMKKNLDKSSH